MHIGDYKVIVYEGGVINHVSLLRDDLSKVFTAGIVYVDSDDASARCVQVGVEIEDGAGICDEGVTGVGIVKEFDESICAVSRSVIDAIFGVCAVIYIENKKSAVFGNQRGEA